MKYTEKHLTRTFWVAFFTGAFLVSFLVQAFEPTRRHLIFSFWAFLCSAVGLIVAVAAMMKNNSREYVEEWRDHRERCSRQYVSQVEMQIPSIVQNAAEPVTESELIPAVVAGFQKQKTAGAVNLSAIDETC